MNAQEVIRFFNMKPHREGGYYLQSYQSTERTPEGRLAGSAICYLLVPDSCSAMHVLTTDEIYHFYLGDPIELLLLYPDGHGETVALGQDILNGQKVQFVAPAGVWQGSRLVKGGQWGLVGTTMAPGYDASAFTMADADQLAEEYPAHTQKILERAYRGGTP